MGDFFVVKVMSAEVRLPSSARSMKTFGVLQYPIAAASAVISHPGADPVISLILRAVDIPPRDHR